METHAETLGKNYDRLFGMFSSFYHVCSEIADLVLPEASDFFETFHSGHTFDKKNLQIYDDTAPEALASFASIMEHLNVPAHEMWCRYQPRRMDLRRNPRVQRYFEELNEAMFAMRYDPRAGFQSQVSAGYTSLGAFGNKIIFTDGRKGGGFRYKACFIGDIVYDVNHQGIVDQVYRRFDWSNQQAWEATQKGGIWEGGKLPEVVRKEIEGSNKQWDRRHQYIHAAVPNNQLDRSKADFRGMDYACVFFHRDSKEEVYRSGYRSNPYAISRYWVSPQEIMGRGPSGRVLNDIKSVNEAMRDYLTISHKIADPPILIHDDAILSGGGSEFNLTPGGENYGMVSRDGRPLAMPFNSGANPNIAERTIMMLQEKIRRAMLVDVFHRVSQKDARMTAYEALLRDREKAAELGPIIGREQTEGINPMLMRELDIAFEQERAGIIRLPEMPQELIDAGREDDSAFEIDIVHESPIMRLQKSGMQIGIDQVMNKAIELANAGNPEPLKRLDGDEILLRTIEASGAPYSILKSDERVAAEQAEEQRQMQLQQMQEMAPAMAKGALDVAKAEQIQQGNI